MKIVIAEDDPVSRRKIQSMLSDWGYDVVATKDGVEAWQMLQREDAPQMAILDWVMPEMDGIAVCRKIRKQARERYVYVLLLTVRGEKKDIVKGLEAGADDYITKPFDPQELKVRLRAGRRVIDLQNQLITAREVLTDAASHDPLTGLLNRSELGNIIEREFARSRRERVLFSVAMVDLDHFKAVNDSHGHMGGDAVLREVAGRLRDSLRPYDSIIRYGGEEFLLVLPGCDSSNAAVVAERACEAIDREPMNTSEGLIHVTVSIGVVTNAHASGVGQDALIKAVDAALYRAKRSGRNRVEIAAAIDCPKPGQETLHSRPQGKN